jgi:hypothetical protein
MSATISHRSLRLPTLGAAVVIAGASALGLAVTHHASVPPDAPSSVCLSAACVGPGHPVLPGRHRPTSRPEPAAPDGGFKPTDGGGRVRAGHP